MTTPTPQYESPGSDIRLYQADALAVLHSLPAGAVDALVTDPPYGIALANHDRGRRRSDRSFRIAGDDDQSAGLAVLKWAEQLGLPTVVFASPWKPWPGTWRNFIAWDKGGAVGGGGDVKTCLKRTWELIQIASNGRMNGTRDVSVWRHVMTARDTRLHICDKPLDLMVRLVERFTNPGDTVIDPFMGSGTTALACAMTGRRFIGVEIVPEYFNTAVDRIEQAVGHMKVAA